jgi:hypothetical protein
MDILQALLAKMGHFANRNSGLYSPYFSPFCEQFQIRNIVFSTDRNTKICIRSVLLFWAASPDRFSDIQSVCDLSSLENGRFLLRLASIRNAEMPTKP